jgi:hypothetical protein
MRDRLSTVWPYEEMERVSPVNYLIKQPDRKKKVQLYHINLLKKYHGREEGVALMAVEDKEQEEALLQVRSGQTLLPEQSRQLDKVIMQFGRVFSPLDVLFHHIHTQPGKKVHTRPYRIPEACQVIAKNELREMLRMRVNEPSTSEWSIVLVHKRDGNMRLCKNFRGENVISTFDAYPMPHVDELLEHLGKAKFITTLDLTKGYWQVPVALEDRPKTAFVTPEGLFQYVRMPFGLHGALETFQRLMDAILRPHQEYAAAYIDDVVIHSEDWDSHLLRLWPVLVSREATGLTTNPKNAAWISPTWNTWDTPLGTEKYINRQKRPGLFRTGPGPSQSGTSEPSWGQQDIIIVSSLGMQPLPTPSQTSSKQNVPNRVAWKDKTEDASQLLKEPVL